MIPSTIWKKKYVGTITECSAVKEFIFWACHTSGFDNTKCLREVQSCVHEAFANIALHGYKNIRDKRPVLIECRINKEEVIIDIFDQGEPFLAQEEECTNQSMKCNAWERNTCMIDFCPKKDIRDWNRLRVSKRVDRTGEDSNL